ncbi:hypothetical protein [uncultured Desulfovibrio sp.]|uniref:hypothetical protein n=1 Tax=uncultured Desulfovibrio sp. TaxID=167968 RepID=UPI002635922B|nr:hypothetical protein [uncultured Desulfovibrio sp.]
MKNNHNSSASCPYCGTVYRHAGMAERCLKGKLCRVYNCVTGERRAVADIQFKAAACVQFCAAPLEHSEYGDVGAHAKRCISLCEDLYADMKALRCGIAVFNGATVPTARLLESIWPPVKTDVTHLLAVVSSLLGDVRYDLRGRLEPQGQKRGAELWSAIEAEVDALLDIFNPDGGEDYPHIDRVIECYECLYQWIFSEPRKPELRLYLAGERLWIAAPTKAEAREILRRETGLVGLKVQGIALGEKLDDGRTAAELLATAQGVPGIVARAA